MARKKGWEIRLDISQDGGASWYQSEETTTVTISKSPETEVVKTIEKNGESETEIISTPTEFEINGFYSEKNYFPEILERSATLKQELHIRLYKQKTDLTAYIEGKAIISDFSPEFGAEGLATYKCTAAIQGKTRLVGNVVG